MNCIPYSELQSDESGFSRLFIDYIDNYSRVKDFFIGDFHDKNLWKSRLDAVTHREIDRSSIAQVLLNQNRDYHCGIKTLANIDLLLSDNTVAIVTGQQVGLFTGPLYTLYKTLTVLKLTEQLSLLHPDTILSRYSGLKEKTMTSKKSVRSLFLINQMNFSGFIILIKKILMEII